MVRQRFPKAANEGTWCPTSRREMRELREAYRDKLKAMSDQLQSGDIVPGILGSVWVVP